MPRKEAWKGKTVALAVTLLVIVLLAVIYFVHKNVTSTPATTRLLFANSATDKLTIADSSDKQVYQLDYPLFGLPTFSAVAPNGQLLVGVSPGVDKEGFILSKNNQAANASSCTVSSTGNQPWSQTYSVDPSGQTIQSPTFYTNWNDNQTKTYTVKCSDNINRSALATWTVATASSYNNTQILPPRCTMDAGIHDNGDGTGYQWWNGSCPEVSPNSGQYPRAPSAVYPGKVV